MLTDALWEAEIFHMYLSVQESILCKWRISPLRTGICIVINYSNLSFKMQMRALNGKIREEMKTGLGNR